MLARMSPRVVTRRGDATPAAAHAALRPKAALTSALSVNSALVEHRCHGAVVEHGDSMAESEQLVEIGAVVEDRRPALGQTEHDSVDLGLRTDVDASSDVIQQEDLAVRQQPFRDHSLLLVPAAQAPTGCRRPEVTM